LLIFVPINLFIAWIWFGTGYTITDMYLKIQSGPFRFNILLQKIKRIKKTRNPLSSPALSLNRIEIKYNKYSSIMISPENTDKFIEEIISKNPHVKIN